MSPDVSFGGTRRPPNDALYDLITRLTVAARRKEEKIARLMGKDVTSNRYFRSLRNLCLGQKHLSADFAAW